MGLEESHLPGFRRIVGRHVPDVETPAAFAQEIDGTVVRRVPGIAVLALPGRQAGMFTRNGVVIPDVACDGRGVVLAPFVFPAFAILVEE